MYPESPVRVNEENQRVIDGPKVQTDHAIRSDESTALSKLGLVSPDNRVFVPKEEGTFPLGARKRKKRPTSSISKVRINKIIAFIFTFNFFTL